jgi:2-oxoglutarate dehydrogenase E2 component (dihydrolipoamide succinyltransferase)
VLEVVAPVSGTITRIVKQEGEIVNSSELIAEFNESTVSVEETIIDTDLSNLEIPEPKVDKLGPAAKRIIAEENIDPSTIESTGKNGRVTKADLVNHMNNKSQDINTAQAEPSAVKNEISFSDSRDEKRVPMSRLRATIAKRLLTVKQETAMLTTFNEVDMLPIKELRSKYGAEFEKQHGVKLGFMGFFVIAAIQALKKFPLVNASIDKTDIVYHGYQDIGVAVSTERGLVVPVIRDADMLSLPDIEKSIMDYSIKARDGKLSMDEMQGGTFTISNGGVFGSLLSTPILNAPQTAILGMHSIQNRPVAIDNEVVIRPMMYLAMSYDHRLLDGKEAVTFLVSIKEQLESPERLLLNL